jgi:hypothetical protein
MMRKLHLGILYRDDKAVNHRSLFKILFNPIFRYFGFELVTVVYSDAYVGGYKWRKCKPRSIKWTLKHNKHDYIVKRRRFI